MKGPDVAPGSELLVGVDGNAFAVLGVTRAALRAAGADGAYIAAWLEDATAADYEHLVGACIVALDGDWTPYEPPEASRFVWEEGDVQVRR